MNIQSETVRKYVLEHLENGSFSSGMRLPGFRRIADELNISGPGWYQTGIMSCRTDGRKTKYICC